MWSVYMYVLYLSSTCVAFATQSSYTPVEQALVPGYKVIHRLCRAAEVSFRRAQLSTFLLVRGWRRSPHTFFFFFFSCFCSIPFIMFALLFSLPPSRNSDPRSHRGLFSPPTHYGWCPAFLSREDFSSFFPRRLASNCAYPS